MKGDWIQTFTGGQFWPLDPSKSHIDIVDIAHALSMTCRYGGHITRFYSVAEHSVLVALNVSERNRKWALLHDAAEAYIVDVPRPLKPFLVNYREAERDVMAAICARFGLDPAMPTEVEDIDHRILGDERAQGMRPCVAEWSPSGELVGAKLQFLAPTEAKNAFLDLFFALWGD